MAKIFGGSASRLEVYALFAAAVVLIGGGISGAVVLTSSDSKPAEVAQSAVEATVASIVPSTPSNPGDSAVEGSQGPIGAGSRTTPSIAGLSESESQIVQDLINRETEAQRLVRLQKERNEFASANPVARYDNAEFLSCTNLPLYDVANPSRFEIITLVKYRITYEAFHQMHPSSYVNPGLEAYQKLESDVRHSIDSSWAFQAPQLPLELSPGRHSVVMAGMLFPGTRSTSIEVRLSPADNTYGWTALDLPLNGSICS
jgi:hypothetical protein